LAGFQQANRALNALSLLIVWQSWVATIKHSWAAKTVRIRVISRVRFFNDDEARTFEREHTVSYRSALLIA
jgi:hypothetical protein